MTPEVKSDRDFEKERQAQADHLAQEACQLAIASGLIQEGERFNAEQASYAESIRQNAAIEHDRIEKEWVAEKEKVNQSEADKQATRKQLQDDLNRVDAQLDVLLADLQSRQFGVTSVDTDADKLVDKSVDKPVDKSVDKPVNEPIDKLVDKPTDKPTDTLVDKPVDKSVDKSVDKPVNELVDKPIDKLVDKLVDKPVDKPVNKRVNEPVDKQADKQVDKFVDKSVDKPVDKLVDKPVDKPVDKLVDKQADYNRQTKTIRQDQSATQAELPNAGDTVMAKLAAVPVLGLGLALLKKKKE